MTVHVFIYDDDTGVHKKLTKNSNWQKLNRIPQFAARAVHKFVKFAIAVKNLHPY